MSAREFILPAPPPPKLRPFPFEWLLQIVADEYGVDVSDLRGRDRHKRIAEARSMAYWALRELTPLSYPEIAGGLCRDSSTILQGYKGITERILDDRRLSDIGARIRETARSRVEARP